MAVPGLVLAYLAIGLLLALVPVLGAPYWIGPALMIPMGALQYRIVISGHEAVHKTLCWPEWLNEAFGIVGQALVGVNFASYRVQHLEHHRASSPEEDPDGHIYRPIVAARRGLSRWLVWTFGTAQEVAVKIVQKGVGSVGTGNVARVEVASRNASRWQSIGVIAAQLGLFAGCWLLTGRFTGYFELWLLPLFVVAVFLNRTRILVEHGLPLALGLRAERGLATLDLDPPAYQRWLLAPFRFNHHGAHHLHMTVPHYNLPRLAALLRRHEVAGFHSTPDTYFQAIAKVLAA